MEKDTRNVIIVLMIVVAAVVGGLFGSMMASQTNRDDIPDKDEIERKDITLYRTLAAVVATVNLVIAAVLILLYVEVYRDVKSDFTVGLIMVMFSFLLYALFSNPLIHSIFGFRAFGLGPFALIPNVFAMIAMSTLLYLSLK
jgi:hypothetical protein